MYPDTYLAIIKSIKNGSTFLPINVALTLSPYGESDSYRNVCPWHVCEEYIFPFGTSIESLKFYAWDSVSGRLNAALFGQVLLTPIRLKSLDISLVPKVVSRCPLFPLPWNCQPPLYYLTTLVMYGKLECTREFLHNFLSAMPNVRSVTVNCCSLDFLDMFTSALYEIRLRNVRHLKLNFVQVFNDSHIAQIEKAKLGLRTLHVAQRSVIRRFHEYERLLTQVAPTLEDAKLTCCTRPITHEQYITIPIMPKLKVLRLQCWGILGVWNFEFINYMPSLETLVMERRGLFAPILHPPDQWHCFTEENEIRPHEKLRNLTLPSIPLLFLHESSLRHILLKFSSLNKLTLSANDVCLECVFTCASQLEELTIAEYSKITDDGITGLVSGLQQLEESGCGESSPYDCNVKVGITALKNLRKLEIDGFWGKVTDFSTKHGITHLPHLESVMLRGCKISDWSIRALPTIQLTVVGHDSLHTFEPEPMDEPIFL
ncbi:unnamed protein product [Orchesella dallaii]|uniref:Uncharacterized protein n=1 Tax=Orchesella dallaii TaxID=48710 RepID=A0ABP1QAY6_9HEXA